MSYLLFINTPDDNGETCEEHVTLDSLQHRKDSIYSMLWLTTEGLDIYASDLEGNEVYLK